VKPLYIKLENLHLYHLYSRLKYQIFYSRNAAFAPKANLAVGNNNSKNDDINSIPKPQYDLSHHHAFALFQLYAVIINIPICIGWAGGIQRVSAILAETPPISILLIAIFSMIWGCGTLCFGIACKVAGVGMGTNLSMCVIAIIGTFLPLITEDNLFTVFGAVICIGLIICCIGLWLATKALGQRDEDEKGVLKTENSEENVNFPLSLEAEKDGNADLEVSKSYNNTDDRDMIQQSENSSTPTQNKNYSTLQKVLICILTGVTAVQLQFAFIFGSPITDLADGKIDDIELPGATPKGGSAAIIWLFAISLGAPPIIFHSLYSSPVPLSHSLRAPWWRHIRLIATTSLPWISHIHIYGLTATVLFKKKVAASIAWPLLMMTTSLWALVLSRILGEWKVASPTTIKTFAVSVCVTMVGLIVLMVSIVVPTKS
jgi:hypothetical protein